MNFAAAYNRQDYLDFFTNTFLPDDFKRDEETITLDFAAAYVKQITKIGESRSLDCIVFEITHNSENDPRVGLSKDSFRLMARYGKRRALALFISPKSKNYRLSLITIDLKWDDGKRVQKEYSNPRRFSFFLGESCKTHTPQQYLSKQVEDFDDLKSRFSIEVVNKEFYNKIAELFTRLAGGKRGSGKNAVDAGKGLLRFVSPDETVRKNFAVRLIGRLIFCWFLKKKKSDKSGIPLLPEELLSLQAVAQNKIYYHKVLEPLFFEVLNTPKEQRKKAYSKDPWTQIPFLNGGLFTPHEDDYYKLTFLGESEFINTLEVPDKWLKELLEIFETYNFTIDENTPVDVELAIEPEMLGRIFENLLAEINPETGETARKATGSYYTPRAIVEYMVDESVKQYLATKTGLADDKLATLLSYADEDGSRFSDKEKDTILDALDTIKIIDPACGSGAFPMGILHKILLVLQKIDPQSKKWLQKILARIDNPTARKEIEKKLKDENWNYVHKLGIIQNSIYGVDIQPIAVEISKLRCFLSLIVDQNVDDARINRGIEPLPNLDFRFVCGNSLIDTVFGLNVQFGVLTNRNEVRKLIASIEQNKSMYFSLSTEQEKVQAQLELLRQKLELAEYLIKDKSDEIGFTKAHTNRFLAEDDLTAKEAKAKAENETIRKELEHLRKQVNDVRSTLEKKKIKTYQEIDKIRDTYFAKFFAWRIDFAEVFASKGGFDIAIANPPYVEHKKLKYISHLLKQNYSTYSGSADLYVYFYEKALDTLCNNGILSFISSNKFIKTSYGENLRGLLASNQIARIVDFTQVHVFDALVASCIMLVAKTLQPNNTVNVTFADDTIVDFGSLRYFVQKHVLEIKQKTLASEIWQLEDISNLKLKSKIELGSKTLSEFDSIEICRGITTGFNDAFVIDDSIRRELIKKSSKNKHIVKPLLQGRNIRKWSYLNSDCWILQTGYDLNIKSDYPDVFKHLGQYENDLRARADQGKSWFNLRACKYYSEFEKDKIIWGLTADKWAFAYDDKGHYLPSNGYILTSSKIPLKYLLALLNSRLMQFYFGFIGIMTAGGAFTLKHETIRELPIKDITAKEQQPYIGLVDKISAVAESPDYFENQVKQAKVKEYERQIDEMTYTLYGLTADEIAIVEHSFQHDISGVKE